MGRTSSVRIYTAGIATGTGPWSTARSLLRAKLAALPLGAADRDTIAQGGQELRQLARRRAVLGQVPGLLAGETRLSAPVYVIWGDEDDLRVIERLRTTPSAVRARTPLQVASRGRVRSGLTPCAASRVGAGPHEGALRLAGAGAQPTFDR